MLSIGYLTLPQLDKERSDKDMQSDLSDGMHSFFDYASACWSMHLRDGVSILEAGEGLSYLLETLELFIELHWSPTHKPLQDLQRVRKTLMNVQVSESFEKVVQAVGWAGKQSSKHGQGPNKDEALDLWQVANKIRSTLEKMATHPLSSTEKQRLRQFYGPNWFKCPRVNCIHYFQGFSTHEQREHHLNKHNRPFLCFVSGCHMRIFGYAAVTELKTHILRYHGIDMFDGVDDIEFPDPPRPKPTSTNNSKATLSCPKCPKTFTRNHNLKNHLRTHDGERPYACNVCGEKFTRKADCVRHERGHGENKFKCAGSLNNGSQWGCQTSFARLDKLVAHFRSKAGQKCVRPQLEEKLRDGDISGMTSDSKLFDGQTGENADALQAAGKSLPSFKDFLELCGLDEPAIDSESAA
jgi:hypothetical protein